jgi:hypothetical protein
MARIKIKAFHGIVDTRLMSLANPVNIAMGTSFVVQKNVIVAPTTGTVITTWWVTPNTSFSIESAILDLEGTFTSNSGSNKGATIDIGIKENNTTFRTLVTGVLLNADFAGNNYAAFGATGKPGMWGGQAADLGYLFADHGGPAGGLYWQSSSKGLVNLNANDYSGQPVQVRVTPVDGAATWNGNFGCTLRGHLLS